MLRIRLLATVIICSLYCSTTFADDTTNTEDQIAKAETALSNNDLTEASHFAHLALQAQPENPNYLFIAGRIAGQQAQQANIFRKLGYARDAKKYFEKALDIDSKHTDSLIGLIRFHQQAPVMAGGEKESIPQLVEQLRLADKKAAFEYDAVALLDKAQLEELDKRYRAALDSEPEEADERFKFDHAMRLSSYGYYAKALDVMLSVQINEINYDSDFAIMRQYQLAKLAAESTTELELGINSIKHYAQFTKQQRTISDDWVQFRLVQLQYLNSNSDSNTTLSNLRSIQSQTDDNNLKTKIKHLIAKLQVEKTHIREG